MNKIYTLEQLKEYLSTLPIGVDAVDTITEYAQLMDNRMDYIRKRVDTAAKLLGQDLITESMDEY
jgi:IS1 family transposase